MRITQMLAGLGLLIFASTASAQYYQPHSVIIQTARPSLNGTPNLYVRNGSPYPIISLFAVQHGFVFSTSTNLLAANGRGGIAGGGQAFIHFPGCIVDIGVMTTTGIRHRFNNVNVCAGSYWTIPVF